MSQPSRSQLRAKTLRTVEELIEEALDIMVAKKALIRLRDKTKAVRTDCRVRDNLTLIRRKILSMESHHR